MLTAIRSAVTTAARTAAPPKAAPPAPAKGPAPAADRVTVGFAPEKGGKKFDTSALAANFAPQPEPKRDVHEVVRPDGKVERQTSETTRSDKSFEELTGAERQPLPANGRNAAEVTRTRTVVIDNSVNPPTEKVVSEGETVSQTFNTQDAQLPEGVTLDSSKSVTTRTQATVTTYGPDGQPTKETSNGYSVHVEGRREDGSTVAITDASATDPHGAKVESRTHTGFTREELERGRFKAGNFDLSLPRGALSHKRSVDHLNDASGGYIRDWVGGDKVDVATTTTTAADGKKTEQVDMGDLDGGDGRKVSRLDGPDGVFWIQQETRNDGKRVATQTTREGDDKFRAETLTERGAGDDVKVTSNVWAGQTLVEENKLDRHQLRTEADLDAYIAKLGKPTPDEQAAYDRMRSEMRAGQPVMVADSSEIRYSHNSTPDSLGSWDKRSTTLSAPGSGVIVGRAGERLNANTGVDTLDGPWQGVVLNGSMYKETGTVVNPGGEPAATGFVKYGREGTISADGLWRVSDQVTDKTQSFKMAADGTVTTSYLGNPDDDLAHYYGEIDHLAHPELEKAADPDYLADKLAPATNGAGAGGDLADAYTKLASKELPGVPGSLLSSVGVLVGGAQIYHGLNEGDLGKTAGGLNAVGSSGLSLLGDTSFGVLGKSLGVVGGVAGIGSGILSVSEGKTVKGFLDAGAGVALIGASLATGPAAPILLGTAAVLTVGSIGYDLSHASDPADLEKPEKIGGQDLFLG